MFAEPGASENLKYTFLVLYKYNGPQWADENQQKKPSSVECRAAADVAGSSDNSVQTCGHTLTAAWPQT